MPRSLALLALLAVLAGCPVKAPNYDYSKEPDPRNSEYVLGIGDDLSINVWENPGLNTEARVRPDGTITMPLIGDLKAVGETPTSLKDTIHDRLAKFVKVEGSEITVAVRGANSYRFTVNGEVTKPGVYNQDHYVTVSEALAMAGGFTRFAKRNAMTLRRRDPKTGAERDIPLAYDLLASSRPDMDIVILAGDALFVP
jgi:polysaccharide export outer membrane protein